MGKGKWLLLVSIAVSCMLFSAALFAQSVPAAPAVPGVPGQNTLQDLLGFDLGVVPDSAGNIGLETGFDFNYGKMIGLDWLTMGASYTKADRTLIEEKDNGRIREVTAISEEITTLQPLALKIDLGNFMTIKPAGNAQLMYQTRKYNKTDRSTDSYKNEEGKLRSLQVNAQLELWFYLGPVEAYVTGSMNPYTRNEETALGFDSYDIATKNEEGNLEYQGLTGDYSFASITETSFYDFKGYLNAKDLLFGIDIYMSGKYTYLSYNYKTKQSEIYNGEAETYTKKKKFEKTDITGTIGIELGFLDLGDATPMATFNYTNSVVDSKTNNIIGAGLLLLQ